MNMDEMGLKARAAARKLALVTSDQKKLILNRMADGLLAAASSIIRENEGDLARAAHSGVPPAMLERLMLNTARIEGIAADLQTVASLPDPVGEIFEETILPGGLRAHKQRVPLGVLGVIYESRPNVTMDVAGLCLKTGNASILRGGSETLNTNRALVKVIREELDACGLPLDAVQFIDDPDRALVHALLQMYEHVDMIIPRGGASLHEFCRLNSRIPVITGGIGICHLFVDATADLPASIDVIRNAKIQRPTVCNALDTILVHGAVAGQFLPALVAGLAEDGVTFRVHESAVPYFGPELPACAAPAGVDDFDTEWLSLVLGIKVVDGLEPAIEHIAAHSTHHSDGILTGDETNAHRFVAEVDSAAVYVNASTRFTDGAQLGLGAEVAVSTQRLHARGPMGPRELTTYKWVIQGNYHTRK